MRFDRLQIVVAQAGTGSRIEACVKRVVWPADNAGVPVMRPVFLRAENVQLVHAFEVPAQSALGALNLERPITFVSLDHAADFQATLTPIGKLHQSTDIVLVSDIFQRATRRRGGVSLREGGAMVNKGSPVTDNSLDWTGQEEAHVNHVR